jgi:hypothetical protein
MSENKSTVFFRHDLNKSYKDKTGKNTIQETIIDGGKGLSFYLLHKESDGKFYRISVKEDEEKPGDFSVKEKINEKETDQKLDMPKILKLIKSSKFDFIRNYIENDRAKYKKELDGGRKKDSTNNSSKKKMTGERKKHSSKKRSSKKKMTGGRKKRSSKKRSSKKKMTGGRKKHSSKKKMTGGRKKHSSKKKMTGGRKKWSSKKRSNKKIIKGFNTFLH